MSIEATAADFEAQAAAALKRCAVIETNMLSRSLAHSVREVARRSALSAGAPEFFERSLMDMAAEFDETRRLSEILGSDDSERDEISGALRPARIATNTASVARRLAAISAAMTRAKGTDT